MNSSRKYGIILICVFVINLFLAYSYAEAKLSGRVTERVGEIVVLNIGYDVDVKFGMKFSVYGIEKQVLLPLSDEQTLIGSYEIIGQIQITKVENNASTGKILQEGENNDQKIKSLCYVEEAEDPPIPNQPPIISSVNINTNTIQPGKQVEIKVDAFDKNSDSLLYTWEADRSYFLSDNTVTPVNYWIAPFEKGDYTITISVSDQRGEFDQMKKTIMASDPDWNRDLGNYQLTRTFKNNIYSGYVGILHTLDVDFDSKNNMYVLDPKEQCVSVFDPQGRYLKTLCAGRFISPTELMIDNDKMYVIYGNNRLIDRYDLMGNQEIAYVRKETTRYEIDVLRKPIALAVGNEGELFVIDGIGSDIAVFEKNGHFRLRFGNSATERGELINPIAISIDCNGYVYVLDTGKGAIVVYNSKMQYEKSIKLKTSDVTDMYLDKRNDRLCLINNTSKNLLVMDTSGNIAQEFGKLKESHKITMDRFGNIYVTNKIDSCIYKFAYKDNTYRYYGRFGTNPFVKIIDIAADKDGSIFLLNESSAEIIKVDKDGWELTRFGNRDNEEKNLKKPVSIVAGAGGEYIYALDKYRKEVLQFSNTGAFLRIIADKKDGRVKDPVCIDSDKEGYLYVVDTKADVCFVYNNSGEFVAQIGTKGKKKEFEYLYKPTKVAVEPTGEIVYIFDDNSTLRKINVYAKDTHGSYPYLRHDKVSEKVSSIKVNNYKRLMASYLSESNPQVINLFDKKGTFERSLTGKDNFITVKDNEVDDTENIYILNNTDDVYVFKQQKLLREK